MRVVFLAAVFVAQLAFETATVKPNGSATCDRDGSFAGGRFVMTCTTLHDLAVVAFTRQDGRTRSDNEIAGGPSWLTADHFDVVAKLPEGRGIGIDAGNTSAGAVSSAERSTINQMRVMLRALLTERFKLAVHSELRDLPVYELRMDRAGGRLGSRMKRVDGPPGGFRTMAQGHIIGHAVTMSSLAQFLEPTVSRSVLDRTGLPGTFDLELEYAPPGDSSGVSVFTAVREQLGVKLDSARAPVDVLVIDRAEKPAAD